MSINMTKMHLSWQCLSLAYFTISLLLFSAVYCQSEDEFGSEADYFKMVPMFGQSQPGLNAPTAPFGRRKGHATKTNSCQHVRGVPDELRKPEGMKPDGLKQFYQKYTETYGIPILSSNNVPDDALKRACYVTRFLLASHSGIRESYYSLFGRIGVIGKNEKTNQIPEHSHLSEWWNTRARGLGGMPTSPVSTCGEENILCLKEDRWGDEDIFLHESSHGIQLLGADFVIPGWNKRLTDLYESSKKSGLWAKTYFMSTAAEYFAEGTQSYFNVNAHREKVDGVHGPISTRSKLKAYDPVLYQLIKEVFPCTSNKYIKRCDTARARENSHVLKMDCDITPDDKDTGGDDEKCEDKNVNCPQWASDNECTKNPGYMGLNCMMSCKLCPGQGKGKACADDVKACVQWAADKECEKNPSYMLKSCRKSCKQC